VRSDVIYTDPRTGQRYRVKNVTGKSPPVESIKEGIKRGTISRDIGVFDQEFQRLNREIARARQRESRERKLLAEGKRLGVEGTQFKDIEKAIKQEAKAEQELKEKARKQVLENRREKKIIEETPEQKAVALSAAQRLNPQPSFSKFEALRASRLAQEKAKVSEPTKAKVSLGGFEIEAEATPFRPQRTPSALGSTAKRLVETGFAVDVDKPERKIIVEEKGRTRIIDVQETVAGERLRLLSSIKTDVPSDARISFPDFKNIQRKRFSEPFNRYLQKDRGAAFKFLGVLAETGGIVSEKTAIKDRLLGPTGTGKPTTTALKTGTQMLNLPFDIAISDAQKIIQFEREAGKLPPTTNRTDFGEVLDLGYSRFVEQVSERAKTPQFEPTDFEKRATDFSLQLARRIKPSKLITEAGVAFLTGTAAKSVLLKGGSAVKTGLQIAAPILIGGVATGVAVETALAPPEERAALLAERAIEIGITFKAFDIGIKSSLPSVPRNLVQPSKGPDFPAKQPDLFVPFKVKEVKLTSSGVSVSQVEVIKIPRKRPGFDVQRFLFEPAKERQLALMPGGKDPLDITAKINPLQEFKSTIRKIQKEKTPSLLDFFEREAVKTRFIVNKKDFLPLTPSQTRLIRDTGLKNTGFSRLGETQQTFFLKTESGKSIPRFPSIKETVLLEAPKTPPRFSLLPKGKRASLGADPQLIRPEPFFGGQILKPTLKTMPEGPITSKPIDEAIGTGRKVIRGVFFGFADVSDIASKAKSLTTEKGETTIDKKTRPKIIIRPRMIEDIRIRDRPAIDTTPKIDTKFKQEQERKIKLTAASFEFNITRPKQPTEEPPPPPTEEPPPPKLPRFPRFPGIDTDKVEKQQGYDVYIREKGQFVRANKAPLPKNRAFNLGSEVTDNTPAATFQLRKTKKKTDKTDAFSKKGLFKFNKKRNNKYIEKDKYRIDSPGEIRGITVKGYLAARRKREIFI
jgi:flagellar biosynthesis GTPase FlhF